MVCCGSTTNRHRVFLNGLLTVFAQKHLLTFEALALPLREVNVFRTYPNGVVQVETPNMETHHGQWIPAGRPGNLQED